MSAAPRLAVLISLSTFSAGAGAYATEHACASHARERAAELLLFHSHGDDRVEIGREIKSVPGITNPANTRQRFDVLEVWGSIYRADYRMRFIYAQMDGCVLMGEEVLQYADL